MSGRRAARARQRRRCWPPARWPAARSTSTATSATSPPARCPAAWTACAAARSSCAATPARASATACGAARCWCSATPATSWPRAWWPARIAHRRPRAARTPATACGAAASCSPAPRPSRRRRPSCRRIADAPVFWQLLARDLARHGGPFADLPARRIAAPPRRPGGRRQGRVDRRPVKRSRCGPPPTRGSRRRANPAASARRWSQSVSFAAWSATPDSAARSDARRLRVPGWVALSCCMPWCRKAAWASSDGRPSVRSACSANASASNS